MQIEATPSSEVTESAVSLATGFSLEGEGFGTRPRTDRPHSISLFAPDHGSPRDGAARRLDVLIGVGIGAAMMYYLDPDRGPQRRAAARDRIAALLARVVAD
jgi:hypothetical protein